MPLSYSLEIAKNSLGVYQRAIDVTAHNIANANNANFSRQQVLFGTEKTDIIGRGQIGSGVKIEDILRVRNNLTDIQIRSYNQKYYDANKRSEILQQVESILAEPSELGLSDSLTSFFNSWDELAVTPNSLTLRNNVVSTAKKLSTQIQSSYDGLNQVKSDTQAEIIEKVEKVNILIKEIQSLNSQVGAAQINNQSANDILDKRDQLIDDLSQLANINISIDKNLSANISIGGVFAVDQYNYSQFTTEIENEKIVIKKTDGGGTISLNGGELYALTDLYSKKVPGYINEIDKIAQAVMDSVNQLHSTGYSLHTPPETSINFFESYEGGNLKINEDILEDVDYIAVSSGANAGDGNGDIALSLADIKKSKLLDGKTILDYYSSFVSGIGTEKQIYDQGSDSNKLVLDQLEVQKASYSGVSIDEEMTNIIRFQRSYDASAKLVKVADEMIQTILTMV